MNVVSYGGGTNSTAMIIGMIERGIPIDLILFADTGGEKPWTYEYVDLFDAWLKERGLRIEPLGYTDKDGNRLTLEDDCLAHGNLPAIAYGWKTCSQKHKIGVQDKLLNNHPECQKIWDKGEKVNKFVGYDAGEITRILSAKPIDDADKKFSRYYPLYEWDWYRPDCVQAILNAGLPLPGKSSCFFCPSMKTDEILKLREKHPDLLERALRIEDNAKDKFISIKGLGRDWSWREYLDAYDRSEHGEPISLCGFFNAIDEPCGCYDGYND
jgi:hypothetical protein